MRLVHKVERFFEVPCAIYTGIQPMVAIAFVDLPQIVRCRADFHELSLSLHQEFDEVWTYAHVPHKVEENTSKWGVIIAASYSGLIPILCPSDPDPLLAEAILRASKRRDVRLIALVSGDTGFFWALKYAKRNGKKVKIILPPDGRSRLLRMIADEVAYLEEYCTCKSMTIETTEVVSSRKG